MKRLIKAEDMQIGLQPPNVFKQQEQQKQQQEQSQQNGLPESPKKDHPKGPNRVKLDSLSHADVNHGRCPICENESAELTEDDGFQTCNGCGSQFKSIGIDMYVIV